MTASNASIIQAATQYGTSDFQQWLDPLTQATTAQVAEAFNDPMNRMYRNQFVDWLIQRVGRTWLVNRDHDFTNPLQVFRNRGRLDYGATLQLLALDYIKTHSYDDEERLSGDTDTSLFGTYRPRGKQAFLTVNSRRRYPITVNERELSQAFTSDTGLAEFVSGVMRVPYNSDNYAEFVLCRDAVEKFDDVNPGLVYRHPAYTVVPDDRDGATRFLKDLQVYADYLRFPNDARRFIPGDVPQTYRPDQLVLLITPEAKASINVDALAQLFHIEPAQVPYRMIVVNHLQEGCFAALMSERSVVLMDNVYETGTFYNPATLSTNMFLHHWELCAVDPYEPIILFGTGDTWNAQGRQETTVTQNATGLQLVPESDTVKPGGTVRIQTKLQGTVDISPSGETLSPLFTVAPDAATWSVELKDGANEESKINSRTYVDVVTGILHVQRTGLHAGDVLTITGTGTYRNPTPDADGTTTPETPYTASCDITIA